MSDTAACFATSRTLAYGWPRMITHAAVHIHTQSGTLHLPLLLKVFPMNQGTKNLAVCAPCPHSTSLLYGNKHPLVPC